MAAAGGHHDQRSTTGSAQSGTEGGGGFTPGWRPDEGSHTTDTLHKWEADEQGTKRKPLPLGLQLNGLQLRFENGKWVTDAMPERPRPQQVVPAADQEAWDELENRLEELQDEGETLKSKNERLRERNSLLEIKNQILLEMLAVSQLDAQKSTEELKKEQTKVEALKWELGRLQMKASQQPVESD